MNKKRNKGMSPLGPRPEVSWNLFYWLAGADKDVLRECSRSARIRIMGMGALVLIPTLFGLVAMSYAVSTLTANPWVYVSIGLMWGAAVLAIDRYVVSTMHKSNVGKSNKVWPTLIRFVFAVVIGIAVAHPLVLFVFNGSITKVLQEEQDDRLIVLEDEMQSDILELREPLKGLEERKDCLAKLITAEQSGVKVELDCGVSSGIIGTSRRVGELKTQLLSVKEEIAAVEERIKPAVEKRQALFENQQRNERDLLTFDYLDQVRGLHILESDKETGNAVTVTKWFLTLLFVLVDVVPLLLKRFTRYGEYEAVRDKHLSWAISTSTSEAEVYKDFAESDLPAHKKKEMEVESFLQSLNQLTSIPTEFLNQSEKERKAFNDMLKNLAKDIARESDPTVQESLQDYYEDFNEAFKSSNGKAQEELLAFVQNYFKDKR